MYMNMESGWESSRPMIQDMDWTLFSTEYVIFSISPLTCCISLFVLLSASSWRPLVAKKYWINPVASRVMAATSISITPDQAERFLMLFSKLSKVFFILIIHS